MKFWVVQDGRVTRTEISKKSGNSELDTMAVEYVKGIVFERSLSLKTQWGRINLKEFQLLKVAVETLRKLIASVRIENEKLKATNKLLMAEVKELKANNMRLKGQGTKERK